MNVIINNKLKTELMSADMKMRMKTGYNPYGLAIMFGAAVDVDTAEKFMNAFVPTREMHGVAKRMGWPLDVDHGKWVLKQR